MVKKSLVNAVEVLPGKIIGYNDHIGVYNFGLVGPVNAPMGGDRGDDCVISQEKFELKRGGEENYMRFSYVSKQLRYLMGEILTTLEASISDERQLKATKSIVKNYFGRKLDWIYENCGMPEEEQDSLGLGIEE